MAGYSSQSFVSVDGIERGRKEAVVIRNTSRLYYIYIDFIVDGIVYNNDMIPPFGIVIIGNK